MVLRPAYQCCRKPHQVRAYIQEMLHNPKFLVPDAARMRGIRGAVRGTLGAHQQDDRLRKLGVSWLLRESETDPVYQRSLSEDKTPDAAVYAIHLWIAPRKLSEIEDAWVPALNFDTEWKWICWEAEAEYNRQHGIIQEQLPMVFEAESCGGMLVSGEIQAQIGEIPDGYTEPGECAGGFLEDDCEPEECLFEESNDNDGFVGDTEFYIEPVQ